MSQTKELAVQIRDSKQRFVRTPEQMEKDHEAAMLRSRGMIYKAIGEWFGVNPSSAYQMVQRAIDEIPKEATEGLIALELAKLDNLERKAHQIVEKHHAYISAGGKVVYDEGERLEDDGPVLQAMHLLLKVADRRARLLGLNAPTRTELTGTMVTVNVEVESERAKEAVLGLLGRLHANG